MLSLGNLYDEFHLGNQNHDIASATELPYFDGDYFPGVAEDWIPGIEKEQAENAKKNKGKKPAPQSKTRGKKLPNAEVGDDLDAELAKKLGVTIQNMRHDFIMAHLAHQCTQCRKCIADDNRWYDSTPSDKGTVFELCQECHDVESALPAHDKVLPRVATWCASGWRRSRLRLGTTARR